MTIRVVLETELGAVQECDHAGTLVQRDGFIECPECGCQWADTTVFPLLWIAPYYWVVAPAAEASEIQGEQ